MPEFSQPFQGNKCDRKLTKEETIRALRYSIASEYEAIQLYEQLEESIDNQDAKKILKEVTEDEKVHVGNFLYLVEKMCPEEKNFIEEGKREAVEIIEE